MTLVDTTVWIDYFRGSPGSRSLASELEGDDVAIHPWTVAELALGNLGKARTAILADLRRVRTALIARDREVLQLIEHHQLHGRGIGWVDAHLLASALLGGVRLWTADRKLKAVATSLGCGRT